MTKKFFILAIGIALALAFTGVVTAQQRDAAAQQKKLQAIRLFLKRVANRLEMSPVQRAAARSILAAAHREARELTDRQAKITVYKDAFARIRSDVLTDSQRQRLDQMKARLQQWRAQHPGELWPS